MSDYFGRLLGLSPANVVRPRLPGLFEPISPDPDESTPVPVSTERTEPARRTERAERSERAEPAQRAEAATLVALVSSTEQPQQARQRPARRRVDEQSEIPAPASLRAGVESVPETARVRPITQGGQPVRPPAGLPTQHPVGAASTPTVAEMPAIPENSTTQVAIPRGTEPVRHHSIAVTTEVNTVHELNEINRVSQVTNLRRVDGNTTIRQRRERAETPQPSEPVIRVSIGRIEVTAATPAPAPARRTGRPRSNTQSLASYLAERDGGRP
ncbi:MAG TPA: hypothetical protein VGM75_09900 [Pseudonocardiaceae bacterium]